MSVVDQLLGRSLATTAPPPGPSAPSWLTLAETTGVDPAWDAFVESVPGATIVQTTLWAESKRRLGIDCLLVRVLHPDGEPAAGAVLQVSSILPGARVGFVPHGPIVDPAFPEAGSTVLDGIEAAARQLHLRAVVVQPGRNTAFLEPALAARGYHLAPIAVAPEMTVELDLTLPYETLSKELSSGRRHVKRPIQAGVTLAEVGTDADVETFHRLYSVSASRQQFEGISLDYLRSQWETLRPSGRIRLFLGYVEGEPLCGLLATTFAGTVTPRFIGWSGEHRGLRVPERLDWFVIGAMRDEGFQRYDQGGIDRRFLAAMAEGRSAEAVRDHPSSYYKYSFGGKVVEMSGPHQLVLNPLLRMAARRVTPALTNNPRLKAMANRWKNG